jgi:hypothetical protein
MSETPRTLADGQSLLGHLAAGIADIIRLDYPNLDVYQTHAGLHECYGFRIDASTRWPTTSNILIYVNDGHRLKALSYSSYHMSFQYSFESGSIINDVAAQVIKWLRLQQEEFDLCQRFIAAAYRQRDEHRHENSG